MHHHGMAAMVALVVGSLVLAQEPKRELKDILPQFEKLVEDSLRRTRVPGAAVVIVHKDKVVYLKGFGIRKVGEAAKVDGDTVFQLASVSKPLATTAVAALVGEKKVGWDDSATKHVPEFRLSDPWVTSEVTLRDLFCHRSGLPGQAGDQIEDLGYRRREVFARLQYLKPAYRFRAGYAYTNWGFTAAGEAAARADGKEWEEFIASKVFKPLGMKSTSARFEDFAKASNRATIHFRTATDVTAKYVRQPDGQSPAGGVSSSARDMGNWLRLQLASGKFDGKQLVAAEALRETHRPHSITGFSPEGRAGMYGLGWGVKYDVDGRIYLRHSGAFFLGVRTEVALLPSEDLGIVTLSNCFPTGLPEAMNDALFDLYLRGKITGDPVDLWDKRFEQLAKVDGPQRDYSKPPAPPQPALAADRYTGSYRNDYFGSLEIAADGEKLTAVVGPKKIRFPLTHWNRDTFTYNQTFESGNGRYGVRFRIGPDGSADQVLLESLEDNGTGPFVRIAK